LPRRCTKCCCGDERQASAKLGETHVTKHWQSKRLTLELSGGVAVRLNEMLDGCDAACSGDNNQPTSAMHEQPTTPKLSALNVQAYDDAARKAAAATDGKPARSWAKRTTRRTHKSYRLTLELSGGVAVRLDELLCHAGKQRVISWVCVLPLRILLDEVRADLLQLDVRWNIDRNILAIRALIATAQGN
jgi:hypothetical protein